MVIMIVNENLPQKFIITNIIFFTVSKKNECPKEYKSLVKDEIPNQKISSLVRFENKIFTACQILNQKIYNVSGFVLNFFFKNQSLNKNVHSKNHVLIEFTSWKERFLHFCAFSKSTILTQK